MPATSLRVTLLVMFGIVAFGWHLFWGSGVSPLHTIDSLDWQILQQLRFPRSLAAIILGASLAMAGLIMQALLRNPLADPGLFGMSSSAGLAVTLFWLMGYTSRLETLGAASLGAALATLLLLSFYARAPQGRHEQLLLIGVAINYISGSLMELLHYWAPDHRLRGLLGWGLGDLGGVGLDEILWVCPVIGLIAWWLWARGTAILDHLALGHSQAFHAGYAIRAWQIAFAILVAILVASVVALAGSIGFIGLMVPQLVRIVFHPAGHRALLGYTLLTAPLVLLVADALARDLLTPQELPVGIILSLLGAPVMLWVLRRPPL